MPTLRISTGSTPEGSMIVSISTPRGGGETEKSSLRTIPSISTRMETDFGRDLRRLADDLRVFDQTRRLEHQELRDNIQALSSRGCRLVFVWPNDLTTYLLPIGLFAVFPPASAMNSKVSMQRFYPCLGSDFPLRFST